MAVLLLNPYRGLTQFFSFLLENIVVEAKVIVQ
jgi:hypothetical protein